MSKKCPRPPLFERLKKGLEEALQHTQGEMELKTTVLEVPDPPLTPKKTSTRKISRVCGLSISSSQDRSSMAESAPIIRAKSKV